MKTKQHTIDKRVLTRELDVTGQASCLGTMLVRRMWIKKVVLNKDTNEAGTDMVHASYKPDLQLPSEMRAKAWSYRQDVPGIPNVSVFFLFTFVIGFQIGKQVEHGENDIIEYDPINGFGVGTQSSVRMKWAMLGLNKDQRAELYRRLEEIACGADETVDEDALFSAPEIKHVDPSTVEVETHDFE